MRFGRDDELETLKEQVAELQRAVHALVAILQNAKPTQAWMRSTDGYSPVAGIEPFVTYRDPTGRVKKLGVGDKQPTLTHYAQEVPHA